MPQARRPPLYRRLRVFTFDPSQALELDTAPVNRSVLSLPWEDLEPGPVGEYVEVVDRDPASDCFYLPVDLEDPHLLAQDGLEPSEGDPQFHQQMVYAVVMITIRNFERALGRKVHWSGRPMGSKVKRSKEARYVARLRCYPHALREANAYYSPEKKALLFGYFRTSAAAAPGMLPNGFVFTCLSHDIIAHETTHAILDGVHHRFIEASNPDSLAFHEAFADIVALFQHFTFPEAIRNQIARTRGNLGQANIAAQLAGEFGKAIGEREALRSGLDNGELRLTPELTEPHQRGAVLVAAVFDAFVTIYKTRIADLLRLVSGQGSRFPRNDLHPDLVERMVAEATKAAAHVLTMCIRALDYCPPVDLSFGEYLRALITADTDLSPTDDDSYRLAMVAAFRRRGIFPEECRSLSSDSLLWLTPRYLTQLPDLGQFDVRLSPDRQASFVRSLENQARMHDLLQGILDRHQDNGAEIERELGLALDPRAAPQTIKRKSGRCVFVVHSVRVGRRVLPDGSARADLVIEVTQGRRGYLDAEVQHHVDTTPWHRQPTPDFWFRGGCTLIVDVATGRVRYVLRKRIQNGVRLQQQRSFLGGRNGEGLSATYLGRSLAAASGEPFALLHRAEAGHNHG